MYMYIFSYYIDCFIARPAICYLLSAKKTKKTKKQCIGEPSPLPQSQSRSPIFWGFSLFFFPWYPSPSKTQPKPSHPECLYIILFFFWFGGGVVARFFETLWTFFLYPLEIKEGYVVILWCAVHTEQTWPREKHTLTCKMHYLRTMVGIGLNM